MKKDTNTNKPEASERLLIYQDQDLHKSNKKILDDIFSEIDNLKNQFLSLDLPFSKEEFVKTLTDGTSFIVESLYNKLAENYKGMSEKVIQSLIEGEKEKLQKLVIPLEPILLKIQDLLNQIELTADQVPFNAKEMPVVNDELKDFLSEKSKRYAEGEEIPVYNAVKKFISAVNEFEQFISNKQYPALMGIPGIRLNDFLEHNFFYQLPYFNIDTDDCDEKGYCVLKLNPDMFEEFRANMKINAERQNLENELRSRPSEVRFDGTRIDIPAGNFKLKSDTGKEVDGNISTSKTRWKGMPGVD